MIRASTIARTAVAAVVSFACAIACAWPSATEADDFNGRPADVGVNTTVVGRVRATSRLVEDASVKGKWYLEIEAKNLNASEAETADLEEEVLRESMSNMMARSGPIPTVAWKVSEKIRVLANETAVVRHPLPAWLSAQVAAAFAPPKLNKNGEPVVISRVSFMTGIDSRVAPEAQVPNVQVAQTKAPSRKSGAPRRSLANAAAQPLARAYLGP